MTSATNGAENLFKVALTLGDNLVIGHYRGQEFSPSEALNLAAWLYVLACSAGGDMEEFTNLVEHLEERYGKPE